MSILEQLVEQPAKPQHKGPAEPPKIDAGDGNHVDVIPYNANFDPQSRFFLSWLWQRLYDDGLIDLYYPQDPAGSFPMFVSLMSSASIRVLLVVVRDAKGEVADCMGFATWEPMQMGQSTVGMAGFIFLKQFWGRVTTRAAGKRIEEFWFKDTSPKLDMAVGIISSENVLANRFVKSLGWQYLGDMPELQQWKGHSTPASLWFLTREQFEGAK